ASMGIQTRVASRAIADGSRPRLCRRRGCGDLPDERWGSELDGDARSTWAWIRIEVDARCRWSGSPHDRARPIRPEAHVHRDLSRWCFPYRRWRGDVE